MTAHEPPRQPMSIAGCNNPMLLQIVRPFDPAQTSDDWFAELPAKAAVFALFPDRDEASPYISRTADLRRRLRRLLGETQEASHKLNLRQFTRRLDYQLTGSRFESQWLLYHLNRLHYPRQYRRRLRMKPPALVKINLQNALPRCYPTRRVAADGSLYYGPFPSHAAADRFTSMFLDLFKIRRCTPDLNPDPAHPGCIYSQMQMCLAPCFKGCTGEEYAHEVARVAAFLDTSGMTLIRELEGEREAACNALEFEAAQRIHRRIEKAHEAMRMKGGLACRLEQLNAVILQRAAVEKELVFFRVIGGRLFGPSTLSLEENVSSPVPLDGRLRAMLDELGSPAGSVKASSARGALSPAPTWEHLTLISRWFYSSFREGEWVPLPASGELPHSRLIRLCRKMASPPAAAEAEPKNAAPPASR